MSDAKVPPILAGKDVGSASVFTPDNLLREARRQKRLAVADVPRLCLLDPDGDIVRYLVGSGQASRDLQWACYQPSFGARL